MKTTLTKGAAAFVLSYAISFYVAFVLKLLWDWFVSPAFHLGEISYWNTVGLCIIASVLSASKEITDRDFAVVKIEKMVYACVPAEKLAETTKELEAYDYTATTGLLLPAIMKGATTTLLLGGGAIVHFFFM